jgi:hypothetical protein
VWVRELVHEVATIVDATAGESVVAGRGWRTGRWRRTGTQLIMIARQKAIVEELRRSHIEAQRTDTVS